MLILLHKTKGQHNKKCYPLIPKMFFDMAKLTKTNKIQPLRGLINKIIQ